jgi:hypothetical protein
VYISDQGNNRVVEVTPSGTETTGAVGPVAKVAGSRERPWPR